MEARLVIPRFNLRAGISFLVDTGADITVLMPDDALAMGVDFSRFAASPAQDARGVGGTTRYAIEPALLVFADRKWVYAYDISLSIAPPSPSVMALPSLLGRDVLDQWSIAYRPSKGHLRATVESASVVIPRPAGQLVQQPVNRRE